MAITFNRDRVQETLHALLDQADDSARVVLGPIDLQSSDIVNQLATTEDIDGQRIIKFWNFYWASRFDTRDAAAGVPNKSVRAEYTYQLDGYRSYSYERSSYADFYDMVDKMMDKIASTIRPTSLPSTVLRTQVSDVTLDIDTIGSEDLVHKAEITFTWQEQVKDQ